MAINLSTTWSIEPHDAHLRRAYPNEVYTNRAVTARRVLSRVAFLREIRTESESTLPPLEIDDARIITKRTPVDECDIYTLARPLRINTRFTIGSVLFSLKMNKNVENTYIGVLSTSEESQIFAVFNVFNEQAREIVLYQDKEDVRAVTTIMRDISALPSFASDAIRFLDDSTVTPEELSWHYLEMKRKTDASVLWTGVKFPLRISEFDNVDATFVETRIARPYVHMTMKYSTPVEVAGKLSLLVDTKHGVTGVHCEFPLDATSIGVPALGENSVLIARFRCVQSFLHEVDVLAYNFPFWTPLSGALPIVEELPLPALDDVDFSDFIGDAIRRQARKRWIDGELEENAPVSDVLLPARFPFGALSSFSLFRGDEEVTWKSLASDGQTLLVLSRVDAFKLRTKKKWRLVVAYVLDGKAYKHNIKFKTTNISGEPLAYGFDLPGPLRFHMELVDDGEHHYALKTLYIDTLTKQQVTEDSDDDQLWERLL